MSPMIINGMSSLVTGGVAATGMMLRGGLTLGLMPFKVGFALTKTGISITRTILGIFPVIGPWVRHNPDPAPPAAQPQQGGAQPEAAQPQQGRAQPAQPEDQDSQTNNYWVSKEVCVKAGLGLCGIAIVSSLAYPLVRDTYHIVRDTAIAVRDFAIWMKDTGAWIGGGIGWTVGSIFGIPAQVGGALSGLKNEVVEVIKQAREGIYVFGNEIVTAVRNVVAGIFSIPAGIVAGIFAFGQGLVDVAKTILEIPMMIINIPRTAITAVYDLVDWMFTASCEKTGQLAGEVLAKGGASLVLGILNSKEVGEAIDRTTSLIGQFWQGAILKSVPWIAGGLATIVSVPLGAHYLYKRAIYNIGRPTLATEVGLIGLAKVQDRAIRAAGATFRAIKSGVIWGVASLGISFTTLIGEEIVCWYKNKGPACLSGLKEEWKRVIEDNGWRGGRRPKEVHSDPKGDILKWSFPAGFAFGALKSFSSESWQLLKGWWTAYNPKPMFTDEMTKQIDEISKTAYNLHKNGGFFQNVLLYGPGGTGKTMVADSIIKGIEKSGVKMNWIKMTGASLAQYIKRGEHVTEVNKLFDYMNNSSNPTILFIDEIEALGMDRDKLDKSELFELIDTFLGHTGTASKKFMIIGATNKKELLDPALLSRMDYKLHIHPPATAERVSILTQEMKHFFSQTERDTLLNEAKIKQIAGQTAGLTGRALCKMVNGIHAAKMASDDKLLTVEMVTRTVTRFVNQERDGLPFYTRWAYNLRLKSY